MIERIKLGQLGLAAYTDILSLQKGGVGITMGVQILTTQLRLSKHSFPTHLSAHPTAPARQLPGRQQVSLLRSLLESQSSLASSCNQRFFFLPIPKMSMGYLQYGRHALRQIIRDSSSRRYSGNVVNPLLYSCQGLRYKKLEVILTTSMEKLGKAGETVKVAPGYFRNHLMPKLLAVPNIDKFAYLIREQRKIYQPNEEETEEVKGVTEPKEDKLREYEKAALRLDKAKLLRETKDEPLELRSPVTKDDLVAEVARQLYVNITLENLHLPSPLSRVGEYEVPLRMPKSIPLSEGKVSWSLKVKIRSR